METSKSRSHSRPSKNNRSSSSSSSSDHNGHTRGNPRNGSYDSDEWNSDSKGGSGSSSYNDSGGNNYRKRQYSSSSSSSSSLFDESATNSSNFSESEGYYWDMPPSNASSPRTEDDEDLSTEIAASAPPEKPKRNSSTRGSKRSRGEENIAVGDDDPHNNSLESINDDDGKVNTNTASSGESNKTNNNNNNNNNNNSNNNNNNNKGSYFGSNNNDNDTITSVNTDDPKKPVPPLVSPDAPESMHAAENGDALPATDTSDGMAPLHLGPWARLMHKFNLWLEASMGRWARRVALRPYLTIFISVVTVMAISSGILMQKVANDSDDLFTPRTSQARTNRDISYKLFPDSASKFTVFILEAKDESADVRTKPLLVEAWKLHELVMSVEAEYEDPQLVALSVDNTMKTIRYTDVCARMIIKGEEAPFCLASSMTGYWNDNLASLEAEPSDASILAKISNPEATGVGGVRMFSPLFFGKGNRALRFAYPTKNNEDVEVMRVAMEKKFVELREAWGKEFPSFNLLLQNDQGNEEELENSTGGDIGLFGGAVAMISVFTWLLLSNPKRPVFSHAMVASCGLLTSFMAIGVSFGGAAFFQVPFVAFISMVLFLVVGIGADDTIIIVKELDRIPYHLAPEERVRRAISHIGGSITLTNLTSMLAFAIGAASVFKSITYFCIYAALALGAQYVLTFTFFTACVAIDARRIAAERVDIVPCFVTRPGALSDPPTGPGGIIEKGIKAVTPLLLSNVGRTVVLLLTAGMVGAGIYGATQVKQGLDVRDLFAKDSYIIPFLNAQEDYFILPWPVAVMVTDIGPDADVDRFNPPTDGVGVRKALGAGSIQPEIRELANIARRSGIVDNPDTTGVECWFDVMTRWASAVDAATLNATSGLGPTMLNSEGYFKDAENFDKIVSDQFLAVPDFASYAGDIVFSKDSGKITAFRMTVRTKGVSLTNTANAKGQMEVLRNALEESTLDPIDHFDAYVYLEGDRVIVQVTLVGMGLTLVAVFILCSVLLVSFETTALVILSIAMIDVMLFGWLVLVGLQLETITMITLVMSAGISCDYCAHTAHSFTGMTGSRVERSAKALLEMGSSVFYGGLSTFLGLSLMAFAKSTIFNMFFKMFAGIVLLGLFVGLVFIPVVLSLIGSSSNVTEDPPEIRMLKDTNIVRPKPQVTPELVSMPGPKQTSH